jgi:hypothetical protein
MPERTRDDAPELLTITEAADRLRAPVATLATGATSASDPAASASAAACSTAATTCTPGSAVSAIAADQEGLIGRPADARVGYHPGAAVSRLPVQLVGCAMWQSVRARGLGRLVRSRSAAGPQDSQSRPSCVTISKQQKPSSGADSNDANNEPYAQREMYKVCHGAIAR